MKNTLTVRRAERSAAQGRKVTQFDVALAVGMSPSQYSLVERGLVDPTPEQRAALAQFFGVPESVVFPEAESSSAAAAVQR